MPPIARTVRSQQPARTMASALARLKSAIESQSDAACPCARFDADAIGPATWLWPVRLLQEKADRGMPGAQRSSPRWPMCS
jgi:hypothetical protein